MRELNQMLGIDTKLSTAHYPQTDGQTERMNQDLEQYLRMFIDHRQEQWPDWLATAEFAYNNKVQTSTKVSPFRANNGQDPCMGFEMRKKRRFEKAEEFAMRMKEVHEEAEAALKKSQEKMRKYANRKRSEVEEYQVGDWMLLSTKDLKYQMKGRRSEKLTERFIGSYQVKGIISTNAIELDLPSMIKIHLVVNISRVQRYKDQVEGHKKEQPAPVITEGEEEYEVEKILNKKKFRGKDWYLVWWKGYMVEEDTWEPRENLGNMEDLVKEFKEEYSEIRRVRKRRNDKEDSKGELSGRYTAKMLYGWDNRRFDKEYWGQLERNQKKWKGKGKERLEKIDKEEEKEETGEGRIEE